MKKIFLLLCLVFNFVLFAEEVPFPEGKDCVAWKTKKAMFFVKVKDPVGINCKIKLETIPEGNKLRVRVLVPVNGFDSGEPSRDSEVVDILKGDKFPNIVFLSEPLDPKEWRTGNPTSLAGTLNVAGNDSPLTLVVKKESAKNLVNGMLVSKFTTFKIDPPSVALGVVAKIDDYLELHFQVSIPK